MPGLKRVYSKSKATASKKKKVAKTYGKTNWMVGNSFGLSLPSNSPLPKKLKSRLTYCEKGVSVNPGAGGIAGDYVFSLNNLYDPNVTGTGHQPLGFDQLAALYRYFVVTKARAFITFYNVDTSNEALCVASVSTSSTSITDITNAIENGRSSYQMVSKAGDSRAIVDMKLAVDIGRELGPKDPIDNPQLWGTSAGGPTTGLFLHTSAAPNSTNDSSLTGISVVIEYDAIFFEPLTVASS